MKQSPTYSHEECKNCVRYDLDCDGNDLFDNTPEINQLLLDAALSIIMLVLGFAILVSALKKWKELLGLRTTTRLDEATRIIKEYRTHTSGVMLPRTYWALCGRLWRR